MAGGYSGHRTALESLRFVRAAVKASVYAVDILGLLMSKWTIDFEDYEFEDSNQRELVRDAIHTLYCTLWDESTVILFSDECQDCANILPNHTVGCSESSSGVPNLSLAQ